MKKQKKNFNRLRRSEICTAYLFILPMFGGLLLFSIIPFIQNILYSFRKMGHLEMEPLLDLPITASC